MMDFIKECISEIQDHLVKIEDLFEGSKKNPFSTKTPVDKNSVYDIIDEIRPLLTDIENNLPNEIKQANRIIDDAESIQNSAKKQADIILKSAENEAEKLVEEHEISKRAAQKARQIDEENKKRARELRQNAYQYADQILTSTEKKIRDSLELFREQTHRTQVELAQTADKLFENLKELRGSK